MIRRFGIERIYERTLSWKEQLKPLLHLSFRLWFFFRCVFEEETFIVNESGETKRHTKHQTNYRKSLSLFLSFYHRKDDVEMKTFRKKLRSSNKQTKTQQRATQTNRRQYRQRKRKKNTNTSERKQLKHHTQKGRNGANRSHSCFVRTQLSFLFVIKAEKFSANTQNILIIFFSFCIASFHRFLSFCNAFRV